MAKILIVEDEKNIAQLLERHLVQEGHACRVAFDGLEGLEGFHSFAPDLVVLDLMLPGLNGLDVCRAIRQESNVPILMLTAKKEEIDVVLGLELGADDYLTKPFGLREFLSRVKSALRRVAWDQARDGAPEGRPEAGEVLRYGDLELNERTRRVLWGGVEIPLTNAEFQVLSILAREPGVVFTRAELQDKARGQLAADTFDRSIDSIVARIRKKIRLAQDETTGAAEIIETIYGIGYRFGK